MTLMKGPPPHILRRGNSLMEATTSLKEVNLILFFMRSIPLVTLTQGVTPPVRVEAEAHKIITEVHQKTREVAEAGEATTFPKEGGNSSYYLDSFKWGFSPSTKLLPFPSSSTPSGVLFSFREGLKKAGSGFTRHLVNGNEVEFPLRSSRSHCHINYDPRINPQVPSSSSTTLVDRSPSRRSYLLKQSSSPYSLHNGLAEAGHPAQINQTPPGFLQQDVLCLKKEWEVSPNNRSIGSQPLHRNSILQNGNSPKDPSFDSSGPLGNKPGCYGCLPFCPHSSRLADIFRFRPRRDRIYVSEDAIWPHHGSLAVHSSNETGEKVPKRKGSFSHLLSGQLLDTCHNESPGRASHFLDPETPGMVRFFDKPGKILCNSASENRIFRTPTKSPDSHFGPPCRKGPKPPLSLSDFFFIFGDDQKRARETSRIPQLRCSIARIRPTPLSPDYKLDEFPYLSILKGSPCSLRCWTKKGFAALPRQEVFANSCFFPSTSPRSGYFDGRIRLWLERCPASFPYTGLLDAFGSFQFNKLERDESYSQYPSVLPQISLRQSSENSYGQSGHIILHQKDGFNSLPSSQQAFKRVTAVLSATQNYFGPCLHPRGSQCSCGPGLQKGSNNNRMVLRSRLIFVDFPSIQYISKGRPFCYEGKYKIRFVCLSVSGSGCLRSGRPFPKLGRPLVMHLPVPPSKFNASSSREDRSFQRNRDSDCPIQGIRLLAPYLGEKSSLHYSTPSRILSLPISIPRDLLQKTQTMESPCLDPLILESDPSDPSLADGLSEVAAEVDSECSPGPVLSGQSSPSGNNRDRLQVYCRGLKNRKFNKNSIKVMAAQHKSGTRHQYQTGWKYWLNFQASENIPNSEATVADFVNFLANHFIDNNRATNTVKNYYYGARDPFEVVTGIDLSSSKDISKFFAGCFQLKRPQRGMALMPKWSLSKLLEFLCGSQFEPLEEASWEDLLTKTVILIQLASGRRIIELAFMSFFCESISNSSVKFRWTREFLAKAERDGSSWSPHLPAINSITTEDKVLCPVRAFNIYYKRRSEEGPEAYNGRMWPFGKVTLSHLVVNTIKNSIGQSNPTLVKIGTHQLRKFAISLSWKFFKASEQDLFNKVGSKSMVTLLSTYIKHVPGVYVPCVVPLGTLMPNSKVRRKLSKN